jgi:CRP-like cAMP-binding protein
MFYVLAGRICLEKNAGEVKKILAEVEPGQYFGEMATLVEAPRSASARALEDSHLAVIDSNIFTNLLRESQGIGVFMLKEFSNRLKNTNESLEEMTNLWIRLITVIHFMENPKAKISQHLGKLTKLAKKLPSEIQEVINDLALKKILEVKDGYVVKVVRKNIWSILKAGSLKA